MTIDRTKPFFKFLNLPKDKLINGILVLVILYFGYRDNRRNEKDGETIANLREDNKNLRTDLDNCGDRHDRLADKYVNLSFDFIDIMKSSTKEIDSIKNTKR